MVAPPSALSETTRILHAIKVPMSVAGIIVFCLGAILYVYVLLRDRDRTADRSRQNADGAAFER